MAAIADDVRNAQDQLLGLAKAARVTGDPSAGLLEAFAATIGAQLRLAELERPVAAVTDAQIDVISKRLAVSVSAWASHLVKALNVRSAAIGLAALAIAIGIGAVGGWLVFAPTTCSDQADGSRVCWVYVREAARR